MRQPVTLQSARYVARYVNGAHVVLDTHSKLHSLPYPRVGDAERAAVEANQRAQRNARR